MLKKLIYILASFTFFTSCFFLQTSETDNYEYSRYKNVKYNTKFSNSRAYLKKKHRYVVKNLYDDMNVSYIIFTDDFKEYTLKTDEYILGMTDEKFAVKKEEKGYLELVAKEFNCNKKLIRENGSWYILKHREKIKLNKKKKEYEMLGRYYAVNNDAFSVYKLKNLEEYIVIETKSIVEKLKKISDDKYSSYDGRIMYVNDSNIPHVILDGRKVELYTNKSKMYAATAKYVDKNNEVKEAFLNMNIRRIDAKRLLVQLNDDVEIFTLDETINEYVSEDRKISLIPNFEKNYVIFKNDKKTDIKLYEMRF